MTRWGLCSRGPGLPISHCNQRFECTTENQESGCRKDFMELQKEDVSIGAVTLTFSLPEARPVLMSPIGPVLEVVLKFSHFLLS